VGSHNAGCGISNITIQEGDRVGFVLLAKSDRPERMAPNVGFASYIRETDTFRPVLPAIYGKYSGYGDIENVTPSKTTELLEKMFSRPIDDIMACVTCTRELYSSCSEIYERYFTGSKAFNEFGVSHEDGLVPLGFTKVSSGDKEEAYRWGKYEIIVRKDGMLSWWAIYNADTEELLVPEFPSQFISNVLDEFSKVSGIFPGYDDADVEKITALNAFYGMFFLEDTFIGMRSYLEENDEDFRDSVEANQGMWNGFVAAQNILKDESEDVVDVVLPNLAMSRFIQQTTALPCDAIPSLSIYGETYEYLELADLATVLAMVNRMFQPSFCGTQDGDDDVSLALNAVTNRIIAERKSRYND
jgi:hypothetical protein